MPEKQNDPTTEAVPDRPEPRLPKLAVAGLP
jgi:hypothetical protein